MPDVFITMKEAAEFEGVKYGTFAQRIARNPKQYKTRTQPQENGCGAGLLCLDEI